MLGKNLSEALGDISDDKIEAAANYVPRGRRQLWVRVAACAAVLALLVTALLWPAAPATKDGEIIAVSGVVKAYACELEDVDATRRAEYALIEGGDFSKISIWFPAAGLWEVSRGITLSFLVDEEELQDHDITLEISTNLGELKGCERKGYPDLGKSTTVSNGETVYWTGHEILKEHDATSETVAQTLDRLGGAYIDIIIKADGNIIGYAVVEIGVVRPDAHMYCSALKSSVYFPKADGEFQKITEEYVSQQIAAVKTG